MRKVIVALGLLSSLLVSCAKEKIEPAWGVQTINDQLGKPFTVSIPIDPMAVDRFGQDFREIDQPELGGVFQDLATMIANIQLDRDNGARVPIEPSYFHFQELDRVNFEIIKSLTIDRVLIEASEITPKEDDTEENDNKDLETTDVEDEAKGLTFIKKLEIYLSFDPEVLKKKEGDEKLDEKEEFKGAIRILSYDKLKNERALGCLGYCLDLKVHKVDWKKILESKRHFIIRTLLKVDTVPRKDMKLGGKINLSAEGNFGF